MTWSSSNVLDAPRLQYPTSHPFSQNFTNNQESSLSSLKPHAGHCLRANMQRYFTRRRSCSSKDSYRHGNQYVVISNDVNTWHWSLILLTIFRWQLLHTISLSNSDAFIKRHLNNVKWQSKSYLHNHNLKWKIILRYQNLLRMLFHVAICRSIYSSLLLLNECRLLVGPIYCTSSHHASSKTKVN